MGKPTKGLLQVQVVLYNTELEQIWRLMWGAAAAVGHAQASFDVSAVLAFGDSSPVPVLTAEDVSDLRREARSAGFEDLTYTFFDENLGSSGGSNRLAENSDSDLILVLNPDTYPVPNMITRLLDAVEDPAVGIAEARQMPLEHPKEYDPVSGDTSWASGCCLMVRRPVFESVGGFDFENFPLYCDDVDFSWRVKFAGYRVVHVPNAVVFHDKRITPTGAPYPASTELYHGTLGRLMLATRYGRPDIVEETLAVIGERGDPAQVKAVEDFEARRRASEVPKPLPGAEKVAQFVGGEYARHRF